MSENANTVCLITDRDPLDQTVRSMVSQLLEMGIDFQFDQQQQLPSALPRPEEGYAAVLIDDPLLAKFDAGQLEALKVSGTQVWRLIEVLGDEQGESRVNLGLNARMLIDLTTHNIAHVMQLHAGLKPDRKQLGRRQAAIKPADVHPLILKQVEHWMNKLDRCQEKAYQYWTVARTLIDAGHEHLLPMIGHSLERAMAGAYLTYHPDGIGGLQQVFWYAKKTGRDDLLKTAMQIGRDLYDRRPRNGDVIAGSGFSDDPLGNATEMPLNARLLYSSYSTRYWTETVRVHGSVFAAMADATGEAKYAHECERIITRLQTHHMRPDMLLAHTSEPDQTDAQLRTSPVWSRGVGHACYGLLSMLEFLPADAPARTGAQNLLRQILTGLIPHQDQDSGLWRNLIDHPESRLETSGSLALGCVLYTGLGDGWLDEDTFGPVAETTFEGLWRMHWHTGLGAYCRGTAASTDPIYYLSRPHGWAPAPYLSMMITLRQAWLDNQRG